MRLTCLFAIVAASASCGTVNEPIQRVPREELSPGDPSPGQSGGRLKKRVLDASDGSQQFAGWYDSVRQENCAFVAGPDGAQRCMPFELVHKITGPSGLDVVGYTDSACTNAVYLTSTPYRGECDKKVRYVYQSPESTPTCAADHFYAYAIGEEADVDITKPIYVKHDIGCVVFNTVEDLAVLKATELAASEFIQATESIVD